MASASTPAAPLSREVVQLHAHRLQDRVLEGECPYPDAVLEANDSFLRALDASPGASVADLRQQHEQRQMRADVFGTVWGGVGLVGGGAALLFAAFGPPGLASAVAMGCAAVASRVCLRLSGRASEESHRQGAIVKHLDAWARHDSDQAPKVPGWQGPVTAAGLKLLAKDFPAELEGFPYAAEVKADHERLLARLDGAGDRPLEDLKAELLQEKPSPVTRAVAVMGRVLANAGWVGGVTALALGQPWVALGLGVAMGAGYGARYVAEHADDTQGVRQARSVHYWQEAMAAVPPVTAQDRIFGQEGPKEPERVIESSQEEVLIGGVRVPRKGGASR